MTRIAPILGIFTVAGACIVLTGCKDLADGMNILEGKPSADQLAFRAHEAEVSGLLSPELGVMEVALEEEKPAAEIEVLPPEPCFVPASMFRSHWCNPDTDKFELIP